MYSMKKITEKVRRIKELEQQISDLETELDNLKYEIKSEMDRRSVTELVGADWKVTWTKFVSHRFDQSKFSKNHPDLYEAYKVDSPSSRFSVK